MSMCSKGLKWHLFQIGVAIDQLVNTLLGGWADCTISARVYVNSQKGYWYAKLAEKILDFIFGLMGDENHCEEAYKSEVNRTQIGEDYQ